MAYQLTYSLQPWMALVDLAMVPNMEYGHSTKMMKKKLTICIEYRTLKTHKL